MFVTAIVTTSSSLKPAARNWSAINASPSSTAGLKIWPRSLDQTVRAGPTSREARQISSQDAFPVCGVVKQRSSSAPRSASASWSAIESRCDGASLAR